jgi:mono/diheme cytochrome c family protein
MRKLISYLKASFIFIAIICCQYSYSQKWETPADKKSKVSPVAFNESTTKEGEALFTKDCQSCHGNPGQGNFLKSLNPQPPDPASSEFQQQTDGEIFYKITTGRAIMPAFKNILSEEERWKVISYIRSFNKSYTQQKPDSTVKSHNNAFKINIDFDKTNNKVIILVKRNLAKGSSFVKDAAVDLFAKRYFGNLQIGKSEQTNIDGKASFDFPKDLPGDKDGNIELIIKVNDDKLGEFEAHKKLQIGIPTDKPSLTENRAIWNVVSKAPIWLLASYIISLLVVLSILGYLVLNLVKIKKLSK